MKQKLYDLYINFFRRRLASFDAVPQLALLGLISGIVTGALVLLFRAAVELPLEAFLPKRDPENFEGLSFLLRGVLPIAGAGLLVLLLYKAKALNRRSGVAYVMERLHYHQGYMNFRSLVIQFCMAVITLLSGQSAGREGPAVCLGSAGASLLGQWMKLPNNSIRLLVGCGTAAAIAASFNTPIAGVIFAMEVVLMEYTIAGFTPVILASVSGAIMSQLVYGNTPAFYVPEVEMNSLLELPFIVLMGIMIGTAAAGFIRLLRWVMTVEKQRWIMRIMLAGLITGLVAMFIPEIMGVGYDSVNSAFNGALALHVLLIIAFAKLAVTAIAVGLGMPSGLIGPTLTVGALLGCAMGMIGTALLPEHASSLAFYTVIGMGAMMGAVLNAPLAALMALLELTYNPHVILPSMLIIVVAEIVCTEVFNQKSVFISILKGHGLDYQHNPLLQALRRVSVGAIMERNIQRSEQIISPEQATKLLKREPRWIIIDQDKKPRSLLPAADLARFMEEIKPLLQEREKAEPDSAETEIPEPAEPKPGLKKGQIDLLSIPAQRQDITALHLQATLQEALDELNRTKMDALYIERIGAPMIRQVLGVVTRTDIESHYQYKKL